MPELTDISVIRALCEKYDFALSKGFGQNFIINPGLPPKIVDASSVDKNWGVLEIGPGIGVCCFEVGPEVVAAAEALLHEPLGALVRPRADGKALLDLKGVNARRLAQLGVPAGQIAVSDACTMCWPDVFWSHRATNGQRGVQAAVITM